MSSRLEAVPILVPSNDISNRYKFNKEKLEKIIKDSGAENLPIVPLSICGEYRGGKSFLLNFFVKYLLSADKETWMNDNKLQQQFICKGGTKGVTSGILVYRKIFKLNLHNGQQVGILLMDSQGIFDENATVNDNNVIFGLTTLLSSLQMYNISRQINENHLLNLQYFAEYAKLVIEKENTKPFQSLYFLIRDWAHDEEFSFGETGGKQYLSDKFKIGNRTNQDSKLLREELNRIYARMSCCLFPYPGKAVDGKTIENLSDIDTKFREVVTCFVASVLGGRNLEVKRINGADVTGNGFVQYMNELVNVFNSNDKVKPETVLHALVRTSCSEVSQKIFKDYTDQMKKKLIKGKCQNVLNQTEFKNFHKSTKKYCTNHFEEKTKHLSLQGLVSGMLADLKKQLDDQFEDFNKQNDNNRMHQKEMIKNFCNEVTQKVTKHYNDAMNAKLLDENYVNQEEFQTFHESTKKYCTNQFEKKTKHLSLQGLVSEMLDELKKQLDDQFKDFEKQNDKKREDKIRHKKELEGLKKKIEEEQKKRTSGIVKSVFGSLGTAVSAVVAPWLTPAYAAATADGIVDAIDAKNALKALDGTEQN